MSRGQQFGVVDLGEGQRIEAALVHALAPGDKVRIALRPENIALGITPKLRGARPVNEVSIDAPENYSVGSG